MQTWFAGWDTARLSRTLKSTYTSQVNKVPPVFELLFNVLVPKQETASPSKMTKTAGGSIAVLNLLNPVPLYLTYTITSFALESTSKRRMIELSE